MSKKRRRGVYCLLVMVLLLGTLAGTVLAQQGPKKVISINGSGLVQLYEEQVGITSALFRGAVGLEYEKVRSSTSSLYVVPALSFGSGALGIRATVGIKNYTKPTAPQGFWWGLYGNFGLASDLWGIALYTTGGGLNIGYKYFLPKDFTAEWSLGLMYLYQTSASFGIGGIAPAVAFKVGYAF